ncbi:MAG: DUF1573 domain-containing protein [Flavobacteriaceae bacterium]|nr:DUF1573 domain-containing protein [Flavobacteriaceae bacterium]MCY4217565.1 DUF1573 domain-containing protein [Flavobacteriaceae bacterium]MCY4254087.1 DUF1573 domain-containing protein [Flavobacteriaceae bacterium]
MNHKIYTTILLGILFVSACKERPSDKIKERNLIAQSETKSVNNLEVLQKSSLEFDRLIHDFGTIEEGQKVETTFYITNIGDTDLQILDAEGSCGCTVPEFPNTPIAPGKKDSIIVSFDSTGFTGNQQKTITLYTNTANGQERVRIKATVQAD